MASTRFLLIATMLAAAACAANAACESGDVFDRITGKQCEQPQKRRESVDPKLETTEGHVIVTTGELKANLTDMQSAAGAKVLFDEVGTKARRADTTIVSLLKELSTGNAAMKDATDGVGTGNVVALTSVVAEMKALRSDVVTEMKALRSDNAKAKGTDPLQQSKAYWLATSAAVLATNEPAAAMEVVGLGLDAYYNPRFPPFFKCIYKVKGDDKATVTTLGKVAKGDDPDYKTFYVACDSPAYVTKKTTYSLTVTYEDGLGARTIPFQGVKGKDGLLFDMVWTAANFVGTDVVVDVKGLDANKAHQCVYTDEANDKIKKITDAKFLPDNKYKLSCGKQPTGFTIKLTTSRVKLAIFVKGTSTQATYAGSGSTLLQLPTCKNGVKDGAESDVDCGGLCGKCGPQKACAKDSDCFNDKCNSKSKKCGGGPGTSQQDPGETCKQIKRDYPKAKNGRYWIRGVNNVLSPFKVYCWLADRGGGGWTLGLVNWYRSGTFGKGDRGNVDGNVLGKKTHAYKLSDTKIRAVIGQKSSASMFEVMQDANGYQHRYTSSNREYNIMKDYTAKWHWTTWRALDESTTVTDFHSYAMNQNFDGANPVGDGTLNWRGRPRCGASGASNNSPQQHNAGIKCYHTPYGGASGFQSEPRGGSKCKNNLGRWSGTFHWFMSHWNTDTYVHVCNGAGHSSSANMAHRWWFRSHKNLEN